MSAPRRGFLAASFFFAVTAPFGVATHLLSEFVGLGRENDAALAFLTRHWYLGIVMLAALISLMTVLCWFPARSRRRYVVELIMALPFRGQGTGFVGLSFATQLAFSVLTQMLEGRPLSAQDVPLGMIAAVVAAFAGALVVTFGSLGFLEFATALWWYEADRGHSSAVKRLSLQKEIAAYLGRRSPVSFRYRPPPLAA